MLERRSGSKVYIVAAALKQSLESFDFINYNAHLMGLDEDDNWRIIDNNQEHSINGLFSDGSLYIQALAAIRIGRIHLTVILALLMNYMPIKTQSSTTSSKKR